MESDRKMFHFEMRRKTYEKMQPETRESNPIKCDTELRVYMYSSLKKLKFCDWSNYNQRNFEFL